MATFRTTGHSCVSNQANRGVCPGIQLHFKSEARQRLTTPQTILFAYAARKTRVVVRKRKREKVFWLTRVEDHGFDQSYQGTSVQIGRFGIA